MSLHFSTLSNYLSMIQNLLHLGAAATQTIQAGGNADPHLADMQKHLDAYANTVATLNATAALVHEASQVQTSTLTPTPAPVVSATPQT